MKSEGLDCQVRNVAGGRGWFGFVVVGFVLCFRKVRFSLDTLSLSLPGRMPRMRMTVPLFKEHFWWFSHPHSGDSLCLSGYARSDVRQTPVPHAIGEKDTMKG